jgi:transcriptional regulator with XRE-family HTH domain
VVDILKRLIHKGQVHAEKLIARYLAKKLGVTFNMISHWETGRRKPPVKYLLVLPQLLGGEITISKSGVYFN